MIKYLSFIALSSVILPACTHSVAEEKHDDNYCLEAAFKKNLEFVTATKQPVTQSIHLTGTVEANPDKVISMKSLFSGVVTNTYFAIGDKVTKGQILAEISSTEYSSLNAELKSIESQMNVAAAKLKAVEAMFKDGIASNRELQEAQSELDILQAEKAKTQSNRNLYSANNAKQVFQVKAPATGIITQKDIATGMQIQADSNDPMFTIANLDEVWVMANVYASNLENIQTGMPVEITTVSYPGEVFHGNISVMSQILDESSKVLKARIVMQNADRKLKPGMLADIMVSKAQGTTAIAVPTAELIFSDNENYVVVYKNDCDIEARKITILAQNSSQVFVSEGLAEHEKIISKNQLLIFNRIKR
ncbi:cobalt-zinc-cadmium efflux system membrane fusion protein [Chitinophaga skermanii]|uniref:Cobalt-zinc-cadmium efflux system membrane fusion protein n=1 Tax=Chitinophaga skermanii TaxID=331697 RepID=A0A327QL71_9BACT|nr:efflux RND transporter periplasmic adaptor subunit [Chitinophaga skermanii]RAJ05416.1 cobalt-zinc-cadmium efflux system membrane fusion protein [Chitinophaga skermanii]